MLIKRRIQRSSSALFATFKVQSLTCYCIFFRQRLLQNLLCLDFLSFLVLINTSYCFYFQLSSSFRFEDATLHTGAPFFNRTSLTTSRLQRHISTELQTATAKDDLPFASFKFQEPIKARFNSVTPVYNDWIRFRQLDSCIVEA